MKNHQQALFVYGTLQRGHRNHEILKHSHFIGPAVTASDHFIMWDVGFPMVAIDYSGHRVSGELYHVDWETLTKCDQLESHPHFYKREAVTVVHRRKLESAWMYLRLPKDRKHWPKLEAVDGLLRWRDLKFA